MFSKHLIIASFASVALLSSAFAGPGSTGGGSALTGEFTASCWRVVRILDLKKQNVVDVDLLKATLRKPLDVKVVDVLIDPDTQQPVSDDHLEAYGSPGLVQLKNSAPWTEYLANPKKLYLVAHELFRASGIQDDGYVLSIGALKLNQLSEVGMPFEKLKEGLYTNNSYSYNACAIQLWINRIEGKVYFEYRQNPSVRHIQCGDRGVIATYSFDDLDSPIAIDAGEKFKREIRPTTDSSFFSIRFKNEGGAWSQADEVFFSLDQ